MPGGTSAAWPHVKTDFPGHCRQGRTQGGHPLLRMGRRAGPGHYVKMVHNGIEYGDMQLICEAYFLLKHALGLGNDELYDVFDAWNRTSWKAT